MDVELEFPSHPGKEIERFEEEFIELNLKKTLKLCDFSWFRLEKKDSSTSQVYKGSLVVNHSMDREALETLDDTVTIDFVAKDKNGDNQSTTSKKYVF